MTKLFPKFLKITVNDDVDYEIEDYDNDDIVMMVMMLQ
jgi:hypothetical protein